MILGMPILDFFIIFILWPTPVIISAIIAFKGDAEKNETN